MDYVRVCAIDAGTRNFAFCVCDNFSWRAPGFWKREDLWAPKPGRRQKPTLQDVIAITHAWCMRNRRMLEVCDVVVLENQIRKPFIAMNTVIQALHFAKTVIAHPMTVARFFDLPKQREPKKKATVALCKEHCDIPKSNGKEDDLADAWMMAVYTLVQRKAISGKYFSEGADTKNKK